MKKVIIISPETGNIPQSIAAAFRAHGWEVQLYLYGPPRRKHLYQVALDRLRDPHCRKAYIKSFNDLLKERVFSQIATFRPDFLLILKGDCLDDDNRDRLIASKVPIITWTLDSLSRAPYQKLLGEISRHIFYIDGGDIPPGDSHASWLPIGFDEAIYHPVCPAEETKKDIDVLLIGKLGFRYERRGLILQKLHRSAIAKNANCAFIGSTGVVMGNLHLYVNHCNRKKPGVTWLSKRIPVEHLARQIARAKVCINVHQDDGVMPINPMFFAIPATGTCQLAEKKPYLSQWLVPGRDYAEFNDENFLEVLADLLIDEQCRTTLVNNGYEASRFHTFTNRVSALVSVL
jgi:hypothetical protein